jgi:hypothetical protein
VSMRHSTTLIRERRRRSTATGSCSRMGPCAVRLCLSGRGVCREGRWDMELQKPGHALRS